VHFAKVGTALVSGAAHTTFGNVDWPVVTRIALPGALGALLGAFRLSALSPTSPPVGGDGARGAGRLRARAV
jgi:uncharacterized membrane protein YfcA